jgi:sterol desaturase/sphingolipid hydroxylase (fatty acid hydroxylase superfamily)
MSPLVSKHVWSNTFDRFPTGKFPIVGPIAVDVYDWGHPQDGRPRMFGQSFLEWFTCAHPRSLIAAYLPGGLIMLALGLHAGLSGGATVGWFLAGLLIWSFLEYIIHRFSFHLTPRNKVGVVFGYLIHGVHHAYPEDPRRWVMPLVVTLPIGTVIFGLLWWLFGLLAFPAMAGVMYGYLAYDTLHYAIHSRPMRSRLGIYLRKHHLQHHYAVPERNFGVSSPLWDIVFRTTR